MARYLSVTSDTVFMHSPSQEIKEDLNINVKGKPGEMKNKKNVIKGEKERHLSDSYL
jgi:hypothetical protein